MGDISVLATYLVMLFTDGKIFVGDVFVGDIFSGNIPCNAPHRWEDLCR